jgi:hypothetical protein
MINKSRRGNAPIFVFAMDTDFCKYVWKHARAGLCFVSWFSVTFGNVHQATRTFKKKMCSQAFTKQKREGTTSFHVIISYEISETMRREGGPRAAPFLHRSADVLWLVVL